MDASSGPQVTIPVTSLPINFKDSTLVVSPTDYRPHPHRKAKAISRGKGASSG